MGRLDQMSLDGITKEFGSVPEFYWDAFKDEDLVDWDGGYALLYSCLRNKHMNFSLEEFEEKFKRATGVEVISEEWRQVAIGEYWAKIGFAQLRLRGKL